jgi:hypothetical protein
MALAPQRAVIVEHGDALRGRNEIRRAFLGNLFDKGNDGMLWRGVVPRWERIGCLGRRHKHERDNENKRSCFHG